MTTTLLPCPFCGKQPEVEKPIGDSDVFWNIYCPCLSPQVMEATEQEAVEKWNRRTTPPDASVDTPPSDAGKAGWLPNKPCENCGGEGHFSEAGRYVACAHCFGTKIEPPTPSNEGKGGMNAS